MSLDFYPTKRLPFNKVYADAKNGKLTGLKFADKPKGMPKSDNSFRLDKGNSASLFCYEDDDGDLFCTGYGIGGFPDKENRCDRIVIQLSKFYKVQFVDENDQVVDKEYVEIADDLDKEASRPADMLNQLTKKAPIGSPPPQPKPTPQGKGDLLDEMLRMI